MKAQYCYSCQTIGGIYADSGCTHHFEYLSVYLVGWRIGLYNRDLGKPYTCPFPAHSLAAIEYQKGYLASKQTTTAEANNTAIKWYIICFRKGTNEIHHVETYHDAFYKTRARAILMNKEYDACIEIEH